MPNTEDEEESKFIQVGVISEHPDRPLSHKGQPSTCCSTKLLQHFSAASSSWGCSSLGEKPGSTLLWGGKEGSMPQGTWHSDVRTEMGWFWSTTHCFCSLAEEKLGCVGRESNPGQLLGRQLCSPLYHQRICLCASLRLLQLTNSTASSFQPPASSTCGGPLPFCLILEDRDEAQLPEAPLSSPSSARPVAASLAAAAGAALHRL